MPRSDLRKRIMHWMWDGRPEWTWPLSDNWPLNRWLSLDDAVGRVLCVFYGHDPICDQCHKPDHDFCSWCRRSMPGMAHRARVTADNIANPEEGT
jgi:hypothetical protein